MTCTRAKNPLCFNSIIGKKKSHSHRFCEDMLLIALLYLHLCSHVGSAVFQAVKNTGYKQPAKLQFLLPGTLKLSAYIWT